MVIGAFVRLSVCDYPEHVLTWEGYGNQSVSSCVCVCVCVCTINS